MPRIARTPRSLAVLALAVVAALVLGAPSAAARTARASEQTAASGGIGLARADWEAVYGEGTPLQALVEYPNVAFPDFTVLVGYEDDRVAHVEFGFEEADAGGLSPQAAADQVAGALPADAELVESFTVPPPQRDGVALRAEWWESPSLADATADSGAILVVHQQRDVIINPGSPMQTVVPRVTLTVPLTDQPAPPSPVAPGGIGLSRAEWEAAYGAGAGTQRGFLYPNLSFPFPGFDVLVRYELETDRVAFLEFFYANGSQLGGVAVEDAQAQIAGAIPPDAVRQHAFSLPATPDGPIPLLIERWDSASLAADTGGPGAILVVAEERLAQQNPGSPPQTVVTKLTLTLPDAEQ